MVLILGFAQLKAAEPEKPEKNNKNTSTTVQIIGKVMDHKTGETLAGVRLKVEGIEKDLYTDLDGNFKIEDLTPGTYNIKIDYVSYKDITLKSVATRTSDTNLKVELESLSHAL